MHQLDSYQIELNGFFDISLAFYLLGFGEKETKIINLIENNGLQKDCVAVSLLKLKDISLNKLNEMQMTDLYYNLELKLVKVLYEMEVVGIKVDDMDIQGYFFVDVKG